MSLFGPNPWWALVIFFLFYIAIFIFSSGLSNGPGWAWWLARIVWNIDSVSLNIYRSKHHRSSMRSVGKERCLRWPLSLGAASCSLTGNTPGGLQIFSGKALRAP